MNFTVFYYLNGRWKSWDWSAPVNTAVTLKEIWRECRESIVQFKPDAVVHHKLYQRCYPGGPCGVSELNPAL